MLYFYDSMRRYKNKGTQIRYKYAEPSKCRVQRKITNLSSAILREMKGNNQIKNWSSAI